jgi:regulator of extracellular matrix RemA (YlzA/DUF370 family)
MDTDHVILSALTPQEISRRHTGVQEEKKEET